MVEDRERWGEKEGERLIPISSHTFQNILVLVIKMPLKSQ